MMKYRLVFKGELVEGTQMEDCLAQLGSLFGKDPEAIRTMLFRGKPIIVKKTDDEQVAGSFITAFEKAGAILNVKTRGLDFTSRQESKSEELTEEDTAKVDRDTEVTRLRRPLKPGEPIIRNARPSLSDDDMTRQRKAVPGDDDLTRQRTVVPDSDDREPSPRTRKK